jgi:exopolysaccharide biosynthesis protein
MIKFLSKPYKWAAILSVLLIASFAFVLLDTFTISRAYASVTTEGASVTTEDTSVTTKVAATTTGETAADVAEGAALTQTRSAAVVTDNSYEDENIKISIETVRKYDSTIYVADIQLSDASYLKTSLAENTYGRNIKATTSSMAAANQAIFAINGDYYGFSDTGYVLRNGTLYRDTAQTDGVSEDLVIDKTGNFSIISECDVRVEDLDTENISQILSFGPALVENWKIAVDSTSEVSQSRTSNPRTAIGQVSALHYIVIVSDGRTNESTGLSLLELAGEFSARGCMTAYNLDGGGSSTMYFNGEIVNHPTDGRTSGEREVSDIAYIGY